MLSHEQIEIIREELCKDTSHEFVEQIILNYITDENNMYNVLNLITSVTQQMLKIKDEVIKLNESAVDMLLYGRSDDRSNKKPRQGKNPKSYNTDFIILFKVCRACFPEGVCDEGDSKVRKDIFTEFIDTIKRTDGFDPNSPNDWEWVNNVHNSGDWFKSVMTQNIDPDWKCPDEY